MKLLFAVALTVLAVLLGACNPIHAAANGDATEIFRGQSGPYLIIVGIQPERPVVGTIHFSISVLDVETMLPIENARVIIGANDPQGEPTYQTPALSTPNAPRFYEGNIIFRSPGEWTLLVTVNSQGRGEAEVTVPLDVHPAPVGTRPEGAFVLAVIVLALVGGTVYLWYSARRQRRESGANH